MATISFAFRILRQSPPVTLSQTEAQRLNVVPNMRDMTFVAQLKENVKGQQSLDLRS